MPAAAAIFSRIPRIFELGFQEYSTPVFAASGLRVDRAKISLSATGYPGLHVVGGALSPVCSVR